VGRSWPLAACLLSLVASSVLAADAEVLNQPDLPAADRSALVSALCNQEMVPIALIEVLALNQGSIREARISAARIASCHDHSALIPVIWQAFLESKLDVGVHDPDIFERHLRTLQRLPPDDVERELLLADPAPIVDLAWDHLLGTWLAPLAEQAGSAEAVRTRQDPMAREQAVAVVRAWLPGLLAHPDGLVRLQTDSGDAAFELLEQVAAVHVAELIRAGTTEEVRLALQLIRQRVPTGPLIEEAIQARLERSPDPELASLADGLPELPVFTVRRGSGLYPVAAPIKVPAPPRSFVLDAPEEASPEAAVRLPLVTLLLGASLVSSALWLLLLRLLPHRRAGLFRLGAVALAPLVLLVLEGVLALVGYHPLIAQRPSFDPTRSPRVISEPIEVPQAGPSVRITDADARYALFPARASRPRIVTFGGSSAHGTHYLAEETFSSQLEARLADVEVINAGVGGVLSDQVAFLAFEALDGWDPDLLIFYLGNNDLEHLHRQVTFRGFDADNLYARYAVDRLRIARLVRSLLPASVLERAADAGEDAATLSPEELGERSAVARLARWSATWNLVRVASRARAQGVDVLFVVQGQNDEACPLLPERITPDCFQQELRKIALDAAAASGSTVVDGAGALRAHAGGDWSNARGATPGVAGYTYYWDAIHPTRLGHAVLAAAIAPEASRLLGRAAQ
jgi:lysophospholipase L1-like esterase